MAGQAGHVRGGRAGGDSPLSTSSMVAGKVACVARDDNSTPVPPSTRHHAIGEKRKTSGFGGGAPGHPDRLFDRLRACSFARLRTGSEPCEASPSCVHRFEDTSGEGRRVFEAGRALRRTLPSLLVSSRGAYQERLPVGTRNAPYALSGQPSWTRAHKGP